MKKCDIKGCNQRATVFSEHFNFCTEHAGKICQDAFDIGSKYNNVKRHISYQKVKREEEKGEEVHEQT